MGKTPVKTEPAVGPPSLLVWFRHRLCSYLSQYPPDVVADAVLVINTLAVELLESGHKLGVISFRLTEGGTLLHIELDHTRLSPRPKGSDELLRMISERTLGTLTWRNGTIIRGSKHATLWAKMRLPQAAADHARDAGGHDGDSPPIRMTG